MKACFSLACIGLLEDTGLRLSLRASLLTQLVLRDCCMQLHKLALPALQTTGNLLSSIHLSSSCGRATSKAARLPRTMASMTLKTGSSS